MNWEDSFYPLVAGSFHRLPEEINENTRFKKDLKVDSLGFLEMILNVECYYHCVLDDELLSLVITVGDLKRLLGRKIAGMVGVYE
ncbi:MAG: acyl carrier protein [Clostridiales bacterium]